MTEWRETYCLECDPGVCLVYFNCEHIPYTLHLEHRKQCDDNSDVSRPPCQIGEDI